MHRTVGSFPGGLTEIFDFQCRSLYNVVHLLALKRDGGGGAWRGGGENCKMRTCIYY
jgi:hypothetical protein